MEISEARAIVTGAARGLGHHVALALAAAGARVMAGDVNGRGVRSLKAEAAELDGSLSGAVVDVTDSKSVEDFVNAAESELGGINVLVNNAGVLRDGVLVGESDGQRHKLPLPQWNKVIDTNLTGQFLMARDVAEKMIGGDADRVIVNISSLARAGNAGQGSYAASKAGLDACTRTWALELARYGIRVAGVAPGVIDTPILAGISESAMASLLESIPLGRIGRPEEVFRAVSFILGCEFFTGRTIEIDGGASMG